MDLDVEATIESPRDNENVSRLRLLFYLLNLVKRNQKQHRKEKTHYPWREKEGVSWEERDAKLYPPGYPLYASFLGRHSEFQNLRRFRVLRMRMLLLKQDNISKLEEELNEIDRMEEAKLFLGSCRRDKNPRRKDIIARLDQAFSEYDDFLQRSQWAINMPDAVPSHIEAMDSWIKKTGCIARPEVKYFRAEPYDLLNIGQVKDQEMSKVAHAIERIVVFLSFVKLKMFPRKSEKEGTQIVIYKPFIRATARALTAVVAIALLLVPIIALNSVQRTLFQFIIIFAAATCFVTVVTVASKASMAEIFAAGAAYSAVLVVFISGNDTQTQTQK